MLDTLDYGGYDVMRHYLPEFDDTRAVLACTLRQTGQRLSAAVSRSGLEDDGSYFVLKPFTSDDLRSRFVASLVRTGGADVVEFAPDAWYLTDTVFTALVERPSGLQRLKLTSPDYDLVRASHYVAILRHHRASLRRVDLSHCTAVNDQVLAALAECPRLQHAAFAGCAQVTDSGLRALAQASLPHLTSLGAGYLPTTTALGFEALAGLTSLERLHMPSIKGVNDATIAKLVPSLQRLTELSIPWTGVTAVGLRAICGQLPRLRTLNMNFLNIAEEDVLAALLSAPQLAEVLASHGPQFTTKSQTVRAAFEAKGITILDPAEPRF